MKIIGGQILDNVDEFVHRYFDEQLFPSRTKFNGDKNKVHEAMMEDEIYSKLNKKERTEAIKILDKMDKNIDRVGRKETKMAFKDLAKLKAKDKVKAKDLTKEELVDVIHRAKCKMLKGLPLESMTKADIIKHLEKAKCPELAKLTEEVYSLEQTIVVSNVWDIKPTKEQLKKWKSKIKVDKHGNHYIYVGKFETETGMDELGGFKLHPKKFEKFALVAVYPALCPIKFE
jgi:hypothetical protein